MSAPPDRKFDISWIQETLGSSISAPVPSPELPDLEPSIPLGSKAGAFDTRAAPLGVSLGSRRLLQIVHSLGGLCHVVDIAERSDLGFNDALRAVLQLVSRQELRILERDPVASDHLVGLTEKGEKLLQAQS